MKFHHDNRQAPWPLAKLHLTLAVAPPSSASHAAIKTPESQDTSAGLAVCGLAHEAFPDFPSQPVCTAPARVHPGRSCPPRSSRPLFLFDGEPTALVSLSDQVDNQWCLPSGTTDAGPPA